MLTGPQIILTLKVAVVAVTLLLLASIVAVLLGKYRLHGRINMAFFVLTLGAVLGLEVIVRFLNPQVFDYFDDATRRTLAIHLCFSLPAAVVLPAMLYTGWTHRRVVHLSLAVLFGVLWTGTFITGVLFLPHNP